MENYKTKCLLDKGKKEIDEEIKRIKKEYSKSKELFEDDQFPAELESLFKNPENVPAYVVEDLNLEWKRP